MSTTTPTRQRNRADGERRRTEVLDTARRLIAQNGFHGVGLDGIARECGMTKQGLLHHFPSKAALLEAVLARQDAIDLDSGALVIEPPTSAAACRGLMDRAMERTAERREIIRLYSVLSVESLHPEHPVHGAFDDRLRNTREWLERAAGAWHPDPPRFALQYLSFVDGLQINWLRDPGIDIVGEWSAFAEFLFAPSR